MGAEACLRTHGEEQKEKGSEKLEEGMFLSPLQWVSLQRGWTAQRCTWFLTQPGAEVRRQLMGEVPNISWCPYISTSPVLP